MNFDIRFPPDRVLLYPMYFVRISEEIWLFYDVFGTLTAFEPLGSLIEVLVHMLRSLVGNHRTDNQASCPDLDCICGSLNTYVVTNHIVDDLPHTGASNNIC